MIVHNLLPIQIPRLRGEVIPTRLCLDDCIATYANHINSDYEMMYIDNWFFLWNKDVSLPYLQRVDLSNNKLHNLFKYYGIKINWYQDNFENADRAISEELKQGGLLILFIDSFYCPWDNGYQKYHTGKHSLLIVGREDETNTLICTDPYFNKVNGKISYDDFKAGYKHYAKIERVELNKVFDRKKILVEKLKSNYMDYFEKIPNLIRELSDFTVLQSILFDDKNNINIDLGNFILDIVDNRTCFLVLLNYIANNDENIKEDLIQYTKELLYIVEQWNVCRAIAIKGMFKQDAKFISQKLPNHLLNIIQMERVCIEGIINVLESRQITNLRDKTVNSKINDISTVPNGNKEFYYLQLDNYFNNEGIGNIDSKTADFTSMNEYILFNDLFKNSIVEAFNMKFRIIKKDGEKDNISCNSEEIDINADYYNEVMFLGCCEWGSFSDNVIVCYDDQSQDIFSLSFLDFVTQTTIGDTNNTVCDYKTIKRVNGINEYSDTNHHLYAKLFKVNSMKKILKIILPECPNIHLFAISLAKFK